ncbi:hypothetical protein QAD02_003449 [Eretmocerus hayati]|uniref:Uncharacterized protein n=1 Tax=Eretmocerus hayati TaxID=131215 RepID=A0ACC2NLQ9_9HYME|nr:hypothetical protein QAD02_003449 [Eretmocerus hayati]
MRNRNKIPGRIIVGFDKTKNQQAQYEEVAAKLKTRLDSGDFNVPGVNWLNSPNLTYDFVDNRTGRNAECADIIRRGCSFMNMVQYFPVPNNKGYSLDSLFSSISNISSFHAPETLSTVDDYHIPFMFRVELAREVLQDKVFPKNEQFDFSRANYKQITSYLSKANWKSIFSKSSSLESNSQDFYDTVAQPINEFVPTKKFYSSDDIYPRYDSIPLN